MTTGQFMYTHEGKWMKVFGPDDNDALSLLKAHVDIRFVTGDRLGFPITKKRIVDDMKYPLDLVSTTHRIHWIRDRWDPLDVIYMGDGIFDCFVAREVGYALAPSNACALMRQAAHHVTTCHGGNRAVAEACLHILQRFFQPFEGVPKDQPIIQSSNEWTA